MGPATVLLTDLQTEAIANLARPLQPSERSAFMAELVEELLGRRFGYAIGDGELHRTLRDLQRRHFRPPTETEDRKFGARERTFTLR